MKHPFSFKTVRLLPLSACLCAVLLSPQVFAEEQFKIGGQDVATVLKTEINSSDAEIFKILTADGFKFRTLKPYVHFVTPKTLDSVVAEVKAKGGTVCKAFNQVYYADKFNSDKTKMVTAHVVFNGASGVFGKIIFTGSLSVLLGSDASDDKSASAFISKYFPAQAPGIWNQDKTTTAESIIKHIEHGDITNEVSAKVKYTKDDLYEAIAHSKDTNKWEVVFENPSALKANRAFGKSAWDNSGIEDTSKANPAIVIVNPSQDLFYQPEGLPKEISTEEVAASTNGSNSKKLEVKAESYKPLGLGIGVVISGWDSPVLAKLHELGFFNLNDLNENEFVFPSNYTEKLSLLKETMKKNVALQVEPPKYTFGLSNINLRKDANNGVFYIKIVYYTRTGVIAGVGLSGNLKVLCQTSGDQRATVLKIIDNLFPYDQIWQWGIFNSANQDKKLKAKDSGAKEEEYNQFRDFFSPTSSDYINKIVAESNYGFDQITFRCRNYEKNLDVFLEKDDFRIQLTLDNNNFHSALLKDVQECKDAFYKEFTDAVLEFRKQKAQKLGESATPANGF